MKNNIDTYFMFNAVKCKIDKNDFDEERCGKCIYGIVYPIEDNDAIISCDVGKIINDVMSYIGKIGNVRSSELLKAINPFLQKAKEYDDNNKSKLEGSEKQNQDEELIPAEPIEPWVPEGPELDLDELYKDEKNDTQHQRN